MLEPYATKAARTVLRGGSESDLAFLPDNANRIPHAHVVANNTNLATGYRLQEPDPRAVKRSIQKLAKGIGLSWFEDTHRPGSATRTRGISSKQQVHVGRAEKELEGKGEYSWVGDIRARVSIARMVARNEHKFRSVLKAMGLDVKDSSAKASRRDWIYSFDNRPTLRVSGEKLGLSFGGFIDFYRFCALRWGDRGMRKEHYLLKQVKAVRNACAHSTAIVNGFAPGTPSDVRTPNEVARALAEIGLNKRARHSKMSNSRVQQITMTSFAYRELVKGTHSREMCRSLVDAFIARSEERSDWYVRSDYFRSALAFLNRVFDRWI